MATSFNQPVLLLFGAFLTTTGMQAQNAAFPLESVSLEGTSLPKESILEISGLQIGSPVDKAAIEAGCSRLNDSGLFESINYRYAQGPNKGYALTLSLTDQPSLVDAAFDLPGIDENEIWKWLTLRYPRFDRKVPANGAAQSFLAKTVEQHLGDKLDGQHLVARLETDLARGKTIISFQPEILPKIAAMNFTGQTEMTSAELAAILQKIVGDQGYTDRQFRQAVELNLRRAYEEHGMYRVTFSSITAKKVPTYSVEVTTAIEEGPKYALGDVQLVGDNLPVDAMLKAAKFKKGSTANWTEIQASIWELERPLKRTGYMDAQARPERILHDDERVLDLRLPFRMGPLYHFGSARFIGLTPALEERARKLWTLQPGDPFDYGYANDFVRTFLNQTDPRQFKKFAVNMDKGAGDHVMNFTVTFEPR